MIRGMTGFGRAQGQAPWGAWVWEIRSVNGKAVDLRTNFPPGCDAVDFEARKRVKERFQRGSFQLQLKVDWVREAAATQVDTRELARLVRLSRHWARSGACAGETGRSAGDAGRGEGRKPHRLDGGRTDDEGPAGGAGCGARHADRVRGLREGEGLMQLVHGHAGAGGAAQSRRRASSRRGSRSWCAKGSRRGWPRFQRTPASMPGPDRAGSSGDGDARGCAGGAGPAVGPHYFCAADVWRRARRLEGSWTFCVRSLTGRPTRYARNRPALS
jgi:hypothetical protein